MRGKSKYRALYIYGNKDYIEEIVMQKMAENSKIRKNICNEVNNM